MSFYTVPQGSVLLCHALKQEERRQKAIERQEREEFERHMIRELIFSLGRIDCRIQKRTLMNQETR